MKIITIAYRRVCNIASMFAISLQAVMERGRFKKKVGNNERIYFKENSQFSDQYCCEM